MGQVDNYKIENEYYRQLVSDRVRSDEALWQAIGACGLSFVYADGLPQSNVIMIGEAPGKDEVKFGRPFAGKAGAILDEILAKTGIRREDIYITNTVKYRLATSGSRPGTFKNRPVKPVEITYSLDWLRHEIEIIKPKIILTLGNVPLKAMSIMQNCAIMSVSACHGKAIGIQVGDMRTTLVPLYHPASQIYNHDLKPVFEEDFHNVKRMYAEI